MILWIFGVLITGAGAAIKVLHGSHARLEERHVEISERVTRIEAVFEMFGQNVLKAMHRTDDFHQADRLIDEYIRRNGELTVAQWQDLRTIFQQVVNEGDAKHARGELVGAAMVVAFCDHKLQAFPK